VFVARNAVPPRVTNSAEWFRQASDELALSVYEELAGRVACEKRVSETIHRQMWPAATSRAHSLIASWTLLYWSMLEHAPDPLTADLGYVRDSKGKTVFAGA
jgi:hypothetical protein